MSAIRLQHISKHFLPALARRSLVAHLTRKPQFHASSLVLRDITFEVQAGECLGIVGPNGSGKSTLLKIIAGILTASSGEIETNGQVLPLFSWDACFIDDLDVRDNLLLFGALIGLSTAQTKAKLDSICQFAGVQNRTHDQMRTFSPGMKSRLALALANESPAPIVVIDEALGAGDAAFRQSCKSVFDQWKKRGRAIVHVSHDIDLLRSLSDRCLLLSNGCLNNFDLSELNNPPKPGTLGLGAE